MNWFRRISNPNDHAPYGVCEAVKRFEDLNFQNLFWDGLYAEWKWLSIQLSHVRAWSKGTDESCRRAICVATLNGNGYIRELAVRSLSKHRHAEVVPFVLWALRDWVSQVRNAADEALSDLLRPEMANTFLAQYRLLCRLDRVQRSNLEQVLNRIAHFLKSEEAEEALGQAIRSGDANQRLFGYRLLAGRLDNDGDLQTLAGTDPDPAVRGWFAAELVNFSDSTRRIWLRRLVLDRSAYVSRRVILELDTAAKKELRDQVVEACCSDSRPVREAARWALDGWCKEDFANLYRTRIQDISMYPKPGWVAGLGETGIAKDIAIIKPFFESSRSRMRCDSLRSIARLDRHAGSKLLIKGLADCSGRVRRAAIAVLAGGFIEKEAESLYDLLLTSQNEWAMISSLRVFARVGSWDAVPAILLGASDDNDTVRLECWTRGATWISQYHRAGWITPSIAVKPILTQAYERFKHSSYEPPVEYRQSWSELVRWTQQVCE